MIHPRRAWRVLAPGLLAASIAGQEPKPGPQCHLLAPILIHFDPQGVMLNDSLLTGLLAPERVRPILALAGPACNLDGSTVYSAEVPRRDTAPQQPPGIFATRLGVNLAGIETLPAGVEQKILNQLIQLLQEQLKARLVDQAQLPLQAHVDDLRKETDRAQAKLTATRRELLTMSSPGSLDKMRERAADLDRRQRDLELDLRTEQSLQELRMKLMAEARERLQEARARRAELANRQGEASSKLMKLNNNSQADDATKAAFARLQEECGRLQSQLDLCAHENSAVERDLDDLANQSRGATLKLHELATRRTLTADELKRIQAEIEASAQQALAMVPLQQAVAEAEAELTLLRELYAGVARRRASVLPVRVELWR